MVETKTWETWSIPDLGDKPTSKADQTDGDTAESPAIVLNEDEAIEEVADWNQDKGEDEDDEESVEEVDTAQVQLPSAEELEQLRKDIELQAYSEGFEKGRNHGEESGHKEAYQQAQAEISAALERLAGIGNALIHPIDQQDQAIEAMMLNSVVTIAKAVVAQELVSQPEQIQQVVHEALAALPQGQDKIKVFINPSDAQFIEQHSSVDQHWQLHQSEEISAGGCRVETADSRVDSTVEQRLQSAIDQFLGRELSTGQASDDDTDLPSQPAEDEDTSAEDGSA